MNGNTSRDPCHGRAGNRTVRDRIPSGAASCDAGTAERDDTASGSVWLRGSGHLLEHNRRLDPVAATEAAAPRRCCTDGVQTVPEGLNPQAGVPRMSLDEIWRKYSARKGTTIRSSWHLCSRSVLLGDRPQRRTALRPAGFLRANRPPRQRCSSGSHFSTTAEMRSSRMRPSSECPGTSEPRSGLNSTTCSHPTIRPDSSPTP